jgi:hypothetical protein
VRNSRWTAALSGASLLAALVLVRLAASANGAAVFFAGRELRWPCPFKLWLELDCPGCGVTRSVVLTMSGDLGGALALNPGGPLLVIGAAGLGAALLFLSLRRDAGEAASLERSLRRLRLCASGYATVVLALLLFRWTLAWV